MASERVASNSNDGAKGLARIGRRGLRPAPLAAWLAIVLGVATLTACDDFDGRDGDRSERGRGRGGDDDRDRRGRWEREPDRPRAPDALDAGDRGDAGSGDAGNDAGADVAGELDVELDAGATYTPPLVDAGADPALDAGDPTVVGLNDGQILAVADALLAGEIEQARVAEALLGDADVIAFASETSAEREAARSTLTSLATAIGIEAEPSSLADDVIAGNATRLESLAAPDGGSIDAVFLSVSEDAHARALERFAALRAAADAPALQAQLLVLEALERSALDRSRELAAGL